EVTSTGYDPGELRRRLGRQAPCTSRGGTMTCRRRMSVLAATIASVLVGVLATPASAHGTAAGDVAPGGFGVVTFTVPNESDNAGTTKLSVQMPQDSPFGSVSVQPKPGWTVEVTRRTLDKPVEVEGSPVSD